MSATNWFEWGGVALLSLAFAGCSAPGDGTDAGTGGAGSGGSGVCPDGGCQADAEDVRTTCENSESGPRLLRRLTRAETEATLRDVFPELTAAGWAGVKLSVDVGSKLGFSNDASSLVVGGATARELQKTAEEVADILTGESVLGAFLPCASAAADAACANEFVNDVGRRLFRRPLDAAETARYVNFQSSVASRSDFATGLKWALSAMIQSPHTFYRSEIGTEVEGGHELTQYELASELSYMYTGSAPDDELLSLAESGGLAEPTTRRAQAERLLTSHPRHLDTVRAFFAEWLNYKKVRGQSRVDDPNFALETSEQLIEETQWFTDTLVFGDNGTVRDLLLADYTALNENLSAFYGFGEVTGADWARVTRPPGRGTGILAQGSVLASTAHQEATSPTLRGLLFYTKFLCNSKPQVPDVVPPITETSAGVEGKTTRQKFEEHHTSSGACKSCHEPFEPFGYTLEQYDETGRYRADEEGLPLDTVATVVLPDGESVEVTSQESLSALVDRTDDIENCVSGLLAAYMFSGAGGQTCLAEPERRALAAEEKGLRDFLVELTQTPHFTTRH